MSRFRSGVLHGEEVSALFDDAQARGYALPAVNIIGTNSLNATLETAAAVGSPVIVQLSNGGAAFYAGKSLKLDNQQAQVLGSVSAAHHVHELAAAYGCRSCSTRTTAPASSFLGLTVSLTGEKRFTRPRANRCFPPT